ncbi:MAG: YlxR family protein [Oscillospiraceae bacterium]|nr:YlxR family protein [Oscillospiraceae bacterium]
MPPKQKHVPLRKCLGCGEMKPKRELIRAVRPPEDAPEREISIDLIGKKPGRGAYLCRSRDCLKAARKAKRLERAFACQIPAEVYERLEAEMAAAEEEHADE